MTEYTDRRLRSVEERVWNHESRIVSLETSRDNERVRHSNTPAWVLGTIAAFVSVASFLFNMYLAGLRP